MLTIFNQFASKIEKFSHFSGRLISWLTLLMVVLVFLVVVLRYVFNIGSIPLQESIIYLHGMVFLLAAAYTLQQDEHVRVDVFYSVMTPQKKAWVDLMGTLIFLFPICGYLFYTSFDYVILSWRIKESSPEAAGLPGLYLLKTLMLMMPILMSIQGLAIVIRSLQTIRAPKRTTEPNSQRGNVND